MKADPGRRKGLVAERTFPRMEIGAQSMDAWNRKMGGKRVKEALRQSTDRLHRFEEIAHLGTWELDPQRNELLWSDEACRIFGFQPGEFAGTFEAFLEGVHPEDRAAVEAAYRDSLIQGRSSYDIEYRVLRKSTGEVRMVQQMCEHVRDASGRVVRSVGMVHDITEQKKMEAELQAGRAFLRQVIDLDPNFVFAKDRQGRFTLVNRAVAEAYGTTVEELEGKTDADFNPNAEEVEFFLSMDNEVMDTGAILRIPEEKITDASGKVRWLQTVKVPIVGPDGKAEQVLGVSTDITERRVAEEALRLLNLELEKRVEGRTAELAATIRELEAFSYSVSHDLRAPLRAINSYASIVREEHAAGLGPEGTRMLDTVIRSAVMMGQLVDDLLAFTRVTRQELQLAPVDLTALTRSVAEELRAAEPRERNIEIRVEKLPEVVGSASLLRQAMVNLLSNALKFTRTREQARIEVFSRPEGEFHRFYVRDNGVGFEMEFAGKLFGVFERLHRIEEFEGSGIGLALVKRIIERLGGEVKGRATPGVGAEFSFTLPRAREAGRPYSSRRPRAVSTSSSRIAYFSIR